MFLLRLLLKGIGNEYHSKERQYSFELRRVTIAGEQKNDCRLDHTRKGMRVLSVVGHRDIVNGEDLLNKYENIVEMM